MSSNSGISVKSKKNNSTEWLLKRTLESRRLKAFEEALKIWYHNADLKCGLSHDDLIILIKHILRYSFKLGYKDFAFLGQWLLSEFGNYDVIFMCFVSIYGSLKVPESTSFLRFYLEACKNMELDLWNYFFPKYTSNKYRSMLHFMFTLAKYERPDDICLLFQYGFEITELPDHNQVLPMSNGTNSKYRKDFNSRMGDHILYDVLSFVGHAGLSDEMLRVIVQGFILTSTFKLPTFDEVRRQFKQRRFVYLPYHVNKYKAKKLCYLYEILFPEATGPSAPVSARTVSN